MYQNTTWAKALDRENKSSENKRRAWQRQQSQPVKSRESSLVVCVNSHKDPVKHQVTTTIPRPGSCFRGNQMSATTRTWPGTADIIFFLSLSLNTFTVKS
jgi:hypothetical protein